MKKQNSLYRMTTSEMQIIPEETPHEDSPSNTPQPTPNSTPMPAPAPASTPTATPAPMPVIPQTGDEFPFALLSAAVFGSIVGFGILAYKLAGQGIFGILQAVASMLQARQYGQQSIQSLNRQSQALASVELNDKTLPYVRRQLKEYSVEGQTTAMSGENN